MKWRKEKQRSQDDLDMEFLRQSNHFVRPYIGLSGRKMFAVGVVDTQEDYCDPELSVAIEKARKAWEGKR